MKFVVPIIIAFQSWPIALIAQLPELGKATSVPSAGGLEMVWCSPSTFQMGSPESESGRQADESQHTVTLTLGFWLGKYEVTQAQWKRVMGTDIRQQRDKYVPNKSLRGEGSRYPVHYVSWEEAMEFCSKLSELERRAGRLPDGFAFLLPTEAQWEFACRANAKSATTYGDQFSSHLANFDGQYPYNHGSSGRDLHRMVQVGKYRPNEWGLYDVHGNVEEWCLDWYGPYGDNNAEDPIGPLTGEKRVVRGGSWLDPGVKMRCADRSYLDPQMASYSVGFRLCLTQ